MKIQLYHAVLNSHDDLDEYYLDSFDALIETIKYLCDYEDMDRVFVLINDDYYENGTNNCIYDIYDLYINDQINSVIRYLKMMNDSNLFKIKSGEDCISISIHECRSYKDAYGQALDLMETSHNCYDKK